MSNNPSEIFFLKEFLKESHLTNIENTPINKYRKLCFKLNYFIKHTPLSFTIIIKVMKIDIT